MDKLVAQNCTPKIPNKNGDGKKTLEEQKE